MQCILLIPDGPGDRGDVAFDGQMGERKFVMFTSLGLKVDIIDASPPKRGSRLPSCAV
jgi:hypothetical protein